MVWVPGGEIFSEAAAAMCREIFCSRRLPFPWLRSGKVIPCSFMMQGGFPLWIATVMERLSAAPAKTHRPFLSTAERTCAHAWLLSLSLVSGLWCLTPEPLKTAFFLWAESTGCRPAVSEGREMSGPVNCSYALCVQACPLFTPSLFEEPVCLSPALSGAYTTWITLHL